MDNEAERAQRFENLMTEASKVGAIGALETILEAIFKGELNCNAQGLLMWIDGFMDIIDPEKQYRGPGEFDVGKVVQ